MLRDKLGWMMKQYVFKWNEGETGANIKLCLIIFSNNILKKKLWIIISDQNRASTKLS